MKTIEELEAALETVTRQRDRLHEQVRTLNSNIETFQKETWRYKHERNEARDELAICTLDLVTAKRERDEARETIVALTTAGAEKDAEIEAIAAALDERDVEAERSLEQYDGLVRQIADQTNETTRARLEGKREIEALTDERDDLRVRVAQQDAELRATREAYIGAKWTNAYRRGAEAMREACEAAIHAAPEGSVAELVIRALPIPEES